MDTSSENSNRHTAVAVFSNAPVPGATKTRLIPSIGADGAAALHRVLTRRTLTTAVAAGIGPVSLWCAPDQNHPFFSECQNDFDISLRDQRGADLGSRMLNTFRDLLEHYAQVVLVGTDCPIFQPEHLRDAATALQDGASAAFCTAEDGGYVLISLAQPESRLFSNMPWGTARVMDATRTRLRELGWNWRELATLWDVDRPDDYVRYSALFDREQNAGRCDD